MNMVVAVGELPPWLSEAEVLWVRLLALQGQGPGAFYSCAVRVQIPFQTLKASSINTALLHGRAFSATASAVTSVSVICLCWHQKSR